MALSWARYEAREPVQSGEQCSTKLLMRVFSVDSISAAPRKNCVWWRVLGGDWLWRPTLIYGSSKKDHGWLWDVGVWRTDLPVLNCEESIQEGLPSGPFRERYWDYEISQDWKTYFKSLSILWFCQSLKRGKRLQPASLKEEWCQGRECNH